MCVFLRGFCMSSLSKSQISTLERARELKGGGTGNEGGGGNVIRISAKSFQR